MPEDLTDRIADRADARVTVVIPAMNEAANLRVVLPTLPPVDEVILVDAGSIDGTVEAAREVMPDIRVLTQTRRGKGNALACGFAAATGDIIVMFDADGSADPAEIPHFVQALRDGADFAKGSRFIEGGGSEDITRFRRAGNAGLHLLVSAAFGSRFTDLCYGYNAFWTSLVPKLSLPDPDIPAPPKGQMLWGDGFEIETLITCRMLQAGVRIAEVPSVERLRLHGASNLNAVSDGVRVLRTIVAERLRQPAVKAFPTDVDAARHTSRESAPARGVIPVDPEAELSA
ncbi:glycosyltransferase family 2 protein [Flexivirga sp. ID2601S]|uniref:Glycosyltransferase family 2 protein n=1 Tax=Flexivirga aerilata TaxID=1656889 RepID=A0A849AFD9_9MICO|nr:glycosyltransferase family 2 protein [Flexivirga aerilata]NNG38553.1 glycosyltransferase family 2 protein [Flexivirga aerilata]